MIIKRTKYVTIKQFAEMFSLSPVYVYKLIHSKGFPVVNFGSKNYRINLDEAIKYIEVNFN